MARKVKQVTEIDVLHATKSELIAYIRAEGKRANTALAEIQTKHKETESFAYDYVASRLGNLTKTSKSGKLSFGLSTKGKSRGELMRLASAIKGYRTASTSTVGGIATHYEKSFESLKNSEKVGKYIKGMSRKEWADITNTVGFKSFMKTFGSDRIFKVYNALEDKNDIFKILESSGELKTVMDIRRYLKRNKISNRGIED